MKFDVVSDKLRENMQPRRIRSEWMQALLDGKTIKFEKADRGRIGGNVATLRARGLRLRTGQISETEVIAWTEPISKNGSE